MRESPVGCGGEDISPPILTHNALIVSHPPEDFPCAFSIPPALLRLDGAGKAAGFLPDFCDNRTVFLIVLIVELLAFVLALIQSRTLERFWTELALISLFAQWVALATAIVLCRCRGWLARLSPPPSP